MDPILVEALFGFSILFGAFGLFTALNLRKNAKANKKKVKQIKQRQRGPHAYSAVLRKLKAYRQNIEKLAAASEVGVHSHRLEKVLQSFDDWEAYIHRLVDRLLEFEANKLMKHEGAVLPKKIRSTRLRLEREKDPRLQKEIQETLDSYLRQQAQLDEFKFMIEKTRLDLEEAVAGVGAIHSQLQTLEAMDVRSRRVRRLSHEIEEERAELDDLLSALDEMYEVET